MKTIKIGGASGFWGDSNIAAPQLLASKQLDYLVFDYLAEITMSIMARQRAQNPDFGYAHDFVSKVLKDSLPEIAEQGVKVISNAGGVNPLSCGRAIERLLSELGLELKVAVVTGDDLIDRVDELRASGAKEMFTGEPLPDELMSVNAYLGGFPIAEALGKGAHIVITGRCVDSAVTLGACIHEFGWQPGDYDRLAGGSLAGHILECGAQATGGLFTDWEETGDWANIGYPIAEVDESGEFVVSKPEGTGGIVCTAGVAEQMVYEIGDPQAYILPDVVCDFSQVQMSDAGEQRVRVSGARGTESTDKLKVSATYKDGFRIVCDLMVRGIDADGKARKTVDSVLRRMRQMLPEEGLPDFIETYVEYHGVEDAYGPHSRVASSREVWAWVGAKHPDPKALALLLRELTSSATSMSPGTIGYTPNRPKPLPVVRLFSLLVERASAPATVHFAGTTTEVAVTAGEHFDPARIERPRIEHEAAIGEVVEVPLIRIAHGRSGDKGNDANIAIIARKPELFPVIREQLSTAVVSDYFAHIVDGEVDRFDLPGICAVNFLLHEVLGGGGVASLRADPQGKALAQMLLDLPVKAPAHLLG